MYLFKNIQNKWIFGTTIYDECPSGQYRVTYNSDFTKLSIRYMSDGTFVEQNRDVSYFKDSNGDPYTNYISFRTSTDGFFANSPSSEAELAMSSIIGSKTDEAATTDTGTFSLISLIKRALQGITTIFTRQSDGSQKTQVVNSNNENEYFSGKKIKGVLEFNRPSDILDYAAYDSIASATTIAEALIFDSNFAIVNGGGGVIELAKIEAPAKWAGLTFQIWLYNSTPTVLYGDNVAFVLDTANSLKRIGIIEVTMGPVINGSSVVYGQKETYLAYKCASDAKTIKAALVTLSAVSAPTSAGKFSIALTATVQN